MKNLKDELKPYIPQNLSVADIVQYVYVVLAGLWSVVGFTVVIVNTFNGYDDWQTGLAILGAVLLILVGAMLVKKFLNNLYSSYRTLPAAQSKNTLLLGFLGSMVFGFLPRIIVIANAYDTELNFFFVSFSLLAIAIIYMLFIAGTKNNYQISYKKSDFFPWAIIIVNHYLFYIALELNFERTSLWIQALMTPICTVSMIEFVQVLRDKVVLVGSKNEPEKEEKKPLAVYEKPFVGLQMEGKDEKSAGLDRFITQSSEVSSEESEPQV